MENQLGRGLLLLLWSFARCLLLCWGFCAAAAAAAAFALAAFAAASANVEQQHRNRPADRHGRTVSWHGLHTTETIKRCWWSLDAAPLARPCCASMCGSDICCGAFMQCLMLICCQDCCRCSQVVMLRRNPSALLLNAVLRTWQITRQCCRNKASTERKHR